MYVTLALHSQYFKGKETDWTNYREKVFEMQTNLNEKSLKALGDQKEIDVEFGMATPATALEGSAAKDESPSKAKVTSLKETVQKTYMFTHLGLRLGAAACMLQPQSE